MPLLMALLALLVLLLFAPVNGAHNYVKTRGDIRCYRARVPAFCLCNPAKAGSSHAMRVMQLVTEGRTARSVNYDLGRVARIDQREWNATDVRVLVARSPYERLISVYLQKFVSRARLQDYWRMHAQRMNASAAEINALGCDVWQDSDTPTFCAFMVYVGANPSVDPHWRPVARACAVGSLSYTTVVHTERREDEHALYTLLGELGRAWLPESAHAQLDAVVRGSVEPVPHAFRDPRLFYTPALLAIVRRVWARDLLAFGYSYGELLARANAFARRTLPDALATQSFLLRKRNTALSLAVGDAAPRTLDGKAVLAYRIALHRALRACQAPLMVVDATDVEIKPPNSFATVHNETELALAAREFEALFGANNAWTQRAAQGDCAALLNQGAQIDQLAFDEALDDETDQSESI